MDINNIIMKLLELDYFKNLEINDYGKDFEEIGIDSVDIMQLFLEVEEVFSINMENIEVKIYNFNDLVDYIQEKTI